MSDGIFDPNVSLDDVVGTVKSSSVNPVEGIGDTDIFNLDNFSLEKLGETKEYWLVGLLILFVIGYYTYNNVKELNDSVNDKNQKINQNEKGSTTFAPPEPNSSEDGCCCWSAGGCSAGGCSCWWLVCWWLFFRFVTVTYRTFRDRGVADDWRWRTSSLINIV